MNTHLLPFLATVVLLPVLLAEVGDWCPWLAKRLVRWSAHRLRSPEDRARYEEEWIANLNEVPGKLSQLIAALGFLASVPSMRATLGSRRGPRARPVEAPNPLPQVITPKETDAATADNSVSPTGEINSTAARLVLGAELRRLRVAHGITRETAGEAIRASHSKIFRLELGRTGFKQRDVADLLTLYGVLDETERTRWLDLARSANAPGWWSEYIDLLLPGRLEPYVGLEDAASLIRKYDVRLIPDLLQTPDYARAVIERDHSYSSEGQFERHLTLLERRQQILHRSRPPTLWAIVDEAAVRRPVGSLATMRGQIEHLIALAELPHVTIQMVPFWAGPVANGPITILRFPDSDVPDVVYLEQLTKGIYLDNQYEIADYIVAMNRLAIQAESPETTLRILRRIREEF